MNRWLRNLAVPFLLTVAGTAAAWMPAGEEPAQPSPEIAKPNAAKLSDPVQSGPGSATVQVISQSWDDVRKAEERLKGVPAPVIFRPEPISPLLVKGMRYENPELIAAKKARIVDFEVKAAAAIAAGQQPPRFWQTFNPATDTQDGTTPTISARIRQLGQANGGAAGDAGGAAGDAGGAAGDAGGAVIPATDPSGAFDNRAPDGNQNWQGIEDTSRPSDAHLAVGAAHIGVMVNTELAFYRKDGTVVVGPTDLAAFFSGNPAGNDLFDPKIIYDVHENRFVMLAINGRRLAQTYWAIAISQTSNPEDSWWVYYLRSDIDGSADTGNWADYPGLGYDSGDTTVSLTTGGGLYVTSNMYTAGDAFQYSKIRVLRKNQLYNGSGSVNWWDFTSFNNADGSNVFTSKPAQMYTATGSPTMYFLNTRSSGGSELTKYRITNPLASGPTLTGPTAIAVNSYDVPPAGKQSGGGTTLLIDSGDCRTQDVTYRNGFLYTACVDTLDWGTPANVEAVVHQFKINATSNAVVWDERFGQDNFYYNYPNVTVDTSNDLTIVFGRTGASEFPGIRYSGRLETDATMQGSALLKAGETTYNASGNTVERWGDYNGIGTDCAGDSRGAFFASQYARTTTQWTTWIGSSSFGLPNVTHLEDLDTTGFISDTLRYYTFRIRSGDWAGIAMYQQIGGNYNLAASTTCPFGSPYQSATLGVDARDFIVANGTKYGNEYHHARVTYSTGPTGFRMEVRNQSFDLGVGSTLAGSFDLTAQVLDLWECSLTSGKTYAAVVSPTNGNCDVDLFMFKGSRFNGRRFDNDGASESNNGTGTAGAETIVFTAAETSIHGFAVTNENFGTSDYTFKVWQRPIVAAIGNESFCTKQDYFGPAPSLSEGSVPVTWSIVTAPAGTTINSSTGVVRWNNAVSGTTTFRIRATNPAGSDDESWLVEFCAADYDCNGFVNGDDYDAFVDAFTAGSLKADFDGNGFVNGDDFDAFAVLFEAGC